MKIANPVVLKKNHATIEPEIVQCRRKLEKSFLSVKHPFVAGRRIVIDV